MKTIHESIEAALAATVEEEPDLAEWSYVPTVEIPPELLTLAAIACRQDAALHDTPLQK